MAEVCDCTPTEFWAEDGAGATVPGEHVGDAAQAVEVRCVPCGLLGRAVEAAARAKYNERFPKGPGFDADPDIHQNGFRDSVRPIVIAALAEVEAPEVERDALWNALAPLREWIVAKQYTTFNGGDAQAESEVKLVLRVLRLAEAERDALAARIARVEALADKWTAGRVRDETDRAIGPVLHAALRGEGE